MPISTLSDEHHQYGYTMMAYLSPGTGIAVRYGIRGSVTIVDRITRNPLYTYISLARNELNVYDWSLDSLFVHTTHPAGLSITEHDRYLNICRAMRLEHSTNEVQNGDWVYQGINGSLVNHAAPARQTNQLEYERMTMDELANVGRGNRPYLGTYENPRRVTSENVDETLRAMRALMSTPVSQYISDSWLRHEMEVRGVDTSVFMPIPIPDDGTVLPKDQSAPPRLKSTVGERLRQVEQNAETRNLSTTR